MKVTTKQVNGGWMVFIDGRKYMDMPRTQNVALAIANDAKSCIKNGAPLNFPE